MYLEFWNFGLVGMQAIFEISCVSIDPVTNLTVNSKAHSNPGKAQRKRENHSQIIVYIQLPGKKNIIWFVFLFSVFSKTNISSLFSIYSDNVNERRHPSLWLQNYK